MYCGIAFRLRLREVFPHDGCCDVKVVCVGKDGGKATSLESAIPPYRLRVQIKQHRKFSTKIKSVARAH